MTEVSEGQILIVDDEGSLREFLSIALQRVGYNVGQAGTGEEALRILEGTAYDLALVDLRMPGIDGLTVLRKAKALDPSLVVVMMTAYSTAETAVEAMKQGAFDYLIKPFKVEELKLVLQRALEQRRLQQENIRLRREVETRYRFENIIGKSPKMHKVFDTILQVAGSPATIFLTGESGTGKELVAKAIHFNSARKARPFITVNCGAVPEGLMESELFGHVKGAFTGAVANKEGLFEAANSGTLFLDEVTEIPHSLQVKLLRVLEDPEVRRVGGTKSIRVDVRIIAASNRDLHDALSQGKLREDLYYRLNVIPIHLPPLRERPEDIPLLATHFLTGFAVKQEAAPKQLTPAALAALESYPWPGNVRELENVIERAATLTSGETIGIENLPDVVAGSMVSKAVQVTFPAEGLDLDRCLAEIEMEIIQKAMERAEGVPQRAADLLRCSLRSLRYRLGKNEGGRENP